MMIADRPFDVLRREVRKWLELENDLLGDVILVAALANRLDGPPVWLMIVAPPSSAKSDLIVGVSALDGAHHISSITENTFASGLRREPGYEVPSLLERLQKAGNWLLTVKDFGTIQSLRADRRKAIFGQLREVYDGQYNAAFGSGVEINWKAKLGLIVGATPEVDRLYAWSAALGERFVQFRPFTPDSGKVALRALVAVASEKERREALARAFREAYLAAQPGLVAAELSPEAHLAVASLAQFVALARTPIRRQPYGAYEVAATEGPGRLVKVLGQLQRAAVVYYSGDVTAATRLVVRVGLDSIPGKRGAALRLVVGSGDGVAVATAANALRCDENTAARELNDLAALGLVQTGKPVRQVVYRASLKQQDWAARIFLDEFEPDEALQKLFDLPNKDAPEEGEGRE